MINIMLSSASVILLVLSTLMTPSRNHQISLKLALSLILILSLVFQPSQSVGLTSSSNSDHQNVQQRKMVLGSRPPGCVNKCRSCQPCKAILVIPPHHQEKGFRKPARREDDTYYLLSWRCRCGNRLFQP